jgi:hypothetical protein
LEENSNTAIQSCLPDGIRQEQQKIAIDFNLIPFIRFLFVALSFLNNIQ